MEDVENFADEFMARFWQPVDVEEFLGEGND
jgi:hypothetical protein